MTKSSRLVSKFVAALMLMPSATSAAQSTVEVKSPEWWRAQAEHYAALVRDKQFLGAWKDDVARSHSHPDVSQTLDGPVSQERLVSAAMERAREGHSRATLDVLQRIIDSKPKDRALEILIQSNVRKGTSWDLMEATDLVNRVLDQAQQKQLRRLVDSKIAVEINAVRAKLGAAHTRKEKERLLSNLARLSVAAGKLTDAEEAVVSMIKVIDQMPQPPDVETFGSVDDEGAKKLCTFHYATIAEAYAERGDREKARSRLHITEQAALEIPKAAGVARSVLLSSVVSAHLKIGDIKKALKFVDALPPDYDRGSLAIDIAKKYLEAGDTKSAVALVTYVPAGFGRGTLLGGFAEELINTGHIAEASQALRQLDGSYWDSAAYRYVGLAMARTGHTALLRDWLATMPGDMARAQACLSAASTLETWSPGVE